MVSEVDNQGRCSQHPFVQLRRRSRQGEWKALLDSCPLCAIDRGSNEDCSGGSSVCVDKEEHEEKQEEERSLIITPDRGLPRRMSKVKFASEGDAIDERNPYVVSHLPKSLLPPNSIDSSEHGSGHSVASNTGSIVSARSALKESKYKVCQKKMQQQLNEIENVTTMSMDLDIHEDSDDEDEEEPIRQSPAPMLESLRSVMEAPQPLIEEEAEEEEEEEERPITHKEPKKKHHGESKRRESKRKDRKRSKRREIRSSLVQVSPNMPRPDPEESCSESSYHPDMPPRSQPSPSYSSGPYTNVVVCKPALDDEVSAISFMDSVKYQPVQYSHRGRPQEDPIAEDPEPQQETNECINTNDYDSKGRCVNHPQIRLRKKKLFGRGWKVLMNACPDCCVDELRRFKNAESTSKRTQFRKSSLEYQGSGSSFKSAPLPLPLKDSSIKSDETSVTASNSSSGSDRSAKNTRHLGNLEHAEQQQIVPRNEGGDKDKEVIFVRQMQWADDSGNKGLYTGEVNSRFTPHGSGSMQYDDGTLREGQWKRGEYRPKRRSRSSSRSRSTRSRSQSKTRTSGRSRSSSRSSVSRTRSRSMSVQPIEARSRSMSVQPSF